MAHFSEQYVSKRAEENNMNLICLCPDARVFGVSSLKVTDISLKDGVCVFKFLVNLALATTYYL